MLGFAKSLVSKTLSLDNMGWQSESADPTKGLRVTVYGFSCADQQSVPKTIPIALNINNQSDFEAALVNALQYVPTGGTCPGQTIDIVVRDIQVDPLTLTRPTKSAILLTDGIFYDTPRPDIAARGLQHFCVQTFALVCFCFSSRRCFPVK